MHDGLISDLGRMVSVDVETAGPNPADYALLSIGACTLLAPRATFYRELRPDKPRSDPEAEAIHRLDLRRLAREGLPPEQALAEMADWLAEAIPDPRGPLFLGFNAAFDWMFLDDYCLHYLGRNPFGHSPVDIKSFIMGLRLVAWEDTSMRRLTDIPLRHNALQDAHDQADIFLNALRKAGILDA
jgi:DNA polymerase III epsilon subunit-like protein